MNSSLQVTRLNNQDAPCIKLHMVSHIMPIQKEVRQGDTISPKLFTVDLEEVLKNLEWEESRIHIYGEYQNNHRFVEDIVLMTVNWCMFRS